MYPTCWTATKLRRYDVCSDKRQRQTWWTYEMLEDNQKMSVTLPFGQSQEKITRETINHWKELSKRKPRIDVGSAIVSGFPNKIQLAGKVDTYVTIGFKRENFTFLTMRRAHGKEKHLRGNSKETLVFFMSTFRRLKTRYYTLISIPFPSCRRIQSRNGSTERPGFGRGKR